MSDVSSVGSANLVAQAIASKMISPEAVAAASASGEAIVEQQQVQVAMLLQANQISRLVLDLLV